MTLVILKASSSYGLIALLGRNAIMHNFLVDKIVVVIYNSDYIAWECAKNKKVP